MNSDIENIYNNILENIKNGKYKVGDKLPSLRQASNIYNLSKYKIEKAYNLLEFYGYVRSIQGSGYFISKEVIDEAELNKKLNNLNKEKDMPLNRFFFKNSFYRDMVNQLIYRGIKGCLRFNKDSFFYLNSGVGRYDTRKYISNYLNNLYDIEVDPSRIIISSSKKHLIDYLIKSYYRDVILLEEPRTKLKRDLFEMNYDNIKYQKSYKGELFFKNDIQPSSIMFVETFDQFPLGISYSEENKNLLEEVATKKDIFIIESLHRKEFVFSKQKFMYPRKKSFLLGDFSSVLPTSIKFAFLVVPKEFKIKYFMNEVSSLSEEFIIALFKNNYFFEASYKIWDLLNRSKKIFERELSTLSIKFNPILSGPYITVFLDSIDKELDIKTKLKLLKYDINPQFFHIENKILFCFEYVNVKIDRISRFVEYIFA